MKTAALVNELETGLKAKLNPQIALEAAEYGKPVSAVAVFSQGFEDPLSLRNYPACLICPDQVRRDAAQALAIEPVDIVLAYKASTKEGVMDGMKVYVDAVANLLEADPSLGGHLYSARFEAAEFIGPSPASALIGVVIARITLEADDLLQ